MVTHAKVIVADSDTLSRRGLIGLLNESATLEVIGEAVTVSEAVYFVRAWQPQVVFVTTSFLRESGIVLITELKEAGPGLRVVITGGAISKKTMLKAVEAGAFAYVSSDASLEDFEYVISEAVTSHRPILPEIAGELLFDALSVGRDRNSRSLTRREREVLDHIALGMSNKEIAGSLVVSVGTVKAHVSNILRKMGAADRTQAIIQGIKEGMIETVKGI